MLVAWLPLSDEGTASCCACYRRAVSAGRREAHVLLGRREAAPFASLRSVPRSSDSGAAMLLLLLLLLQSATKQQQ